MKWLFFIFCTLCVTSSSLFSVVDQKLIDDLFLEGMTVDLRDPTYSDGVLSTDHGGVVAGSGIRVQAMKISYTRKLSEGQPVLTLVAEGNLMIHYGEYLFIGSRLEYDFQSKYGTIEEGRFGIEPWYFGGEQIELLPDGSYHIHNGYFTTSPNRNTAWHIYSEETTISNHYFLTASNVQFRLGKLPLFWMPLFKTKLSWIFDNPIRYRIRSGGKQGYRIGMIYECFSTTHLKSFLRFDYRVDRGPAGGFEIDYRSPERCEKLQMINYLARDSSNENPEERTRYRFEGVYHKAFNDDHLKLDLTYDKLSDKEMSTDYNEKGLELKTADRTQLNIRHQQDQYWIANLYTRIRVNDFQTVKEEWPTLGIVSYPFSIGSSGVISNNFFKIGYLDFKYAKDLPKVSDFNSSRIEFRHTLYRPFVFSPVTITPEIGLLAIFYNNSPSSTDRWVTLAALGGEMNTSLYHHYGCYKHIVEPYLRYQYLSTPATSPQEHYIFDIQDGWSTLNMARFGLRHLLYRKNENALVVRSLTADLYANAFFNTATISRTVPKVYFELNWDTFPYLKNILKTAWDLQHCRLDHYNLRSEWTFSEDLAIAAEYRYRDIFAWRKADYNNFILDSFRTEHELLKSPLSDRRQTLLFQLFYRLSPTWILEFQSRNGWNRQKEPSYTEYQVDLLTILDSTWHLRISYQYKEDDRRFAVYLSLGAKRPKKCR